MTLMFNPYTGRPRHPSDISSDPDGRALVDPEAPVRAFRPAPAAPAEVALRELLEAVEALGVPAPTENPTLAESRLVLAKNAARNVLGLPR